MPKINEQFDKLKAMREGRDGKPADQPRNADGTFATPATEQRAKPDEIAEEQKRLEAGEQVGGAPETDDGDEDDDEPTTVTTTPPKPADAAPAVAAPPGTEEVEIDGKKVFVAPELAAALRASEQDTTPPPPVIDPKKIADDVIAQLDDRLPKRKTQAELDADAALAAAANDKPVPMPDANLAVTDPAKYNEQLQAHIDDKAARAAQKAIADRDAKDAEARKTTAADEAKRQEAWAREQLGIQFYRQFKVLGDDTDIKEIVDGMLNKKLDEVIASGALQKKLTPAEGEALKMKAFNEVAAAATKKIVKLRGTPTAAQAPTPPPTLATSTAANKGPAKPPKAPASKPKEKYPTGSVSAMLAKHKLDKEGPRPKPVA